MRKPPSLAGSKSLEADLVFGHRPGWPHTERTLHALPSLTAHRSHVCHLRRSGHALAEQARLARNHDPPSTDLRQAARRHSCVGWVENHRRLPSARYKYCRYPLSAGTEQMQRGCCHRPPLKTWKCRCLTTRWRAGMRKALRRLLRGQWVSGLDRRLSISMQDTTAALK